MLTAARTHGRTAWKDNPLTRFDFDSNFEIICFCSSLSLVVVLYKLIGSSNIINCGINVRVAEPVSVRVCPSYSMSLEKYVLFIHWKIYI